MKGYKKTIVVFGCTGTVGKVVFENLLQEDCYVRGIVRHPQRSLPVPLNSLNKHCYLSADLNNPKEKKEELNPSRPQTLLGAWDKCFVLCCATLRIARRSEELYQDENKQEPELRFFASVLGPSW